MSISYKKPKLKNIHYDNFVSKLSSLSGKVIVITGTTSGTGYVAAKTVAERGAKVILLNRASNRAEDSLKKLKEDCPKAELINVECDLQSFASVRQAAQKIASLCTGGIDVLCNNAGVMALTDKATGDGFDVQMQTNHLSHFLLTKELMPYLEKSAAQKADARIVNHSSVARFGVKKLEKKYLEKNGGNLGGDGSRMMPFPGGRWVRYSQTKLANAAFTACLHEKLQAKKSNIKAVVAHPGLAITDLQTTTVKDGGMGGWFTSFFMKSGQTQEDGALGIIKGMIEENINSGVFIGPGSGKFALKGEVVKFPLESFYDNQAIRDMLWQKSCEAIGEDFVI